MRIKYIFIILICFSILSCIPQPEAPEEDLLVTGKHGAYVLCEGLYGQNNSSLTRVDEISGDYFLNYIETVNPALNFGDTANDLVVKGDTSYIVVSTNKKIIVFNTKTGKVISEIYLNGKRYPRKIAFLNDSIASITDLYDHSFSIINTNSLKIIQEHIATGPAPEGIAVYNNYLFIANSGYGDYLAKEPKAGTISVFNKTILKEINLISNIPNVIELNINTQTGLLYARYNNLPKYKDSTGGIVEIDINTLTEKRRWRDKAGSFVINESENKIYYLCNEGVRTINIAEDNAKPELIIHKTNKNDIWYSIAISQQNEIWIGNAKNYQSMGEILIFNNTSPVQLLRTIPVGLNPNTIVFF